MHSSTGREKRQVDGSQAKGAERTLEILKSLAAHPYGVSLDDLSRELGYPKSSVHRALAILERSGLAHHPQSGQYVLGSEFVRLAYAHQEARQEQVLVMPCLQELSETYGETTHYAELDGQEVVYQAKVTPRGQRVQMTSIIGGRNPAWSTALGKALLASRLPADDPLGFLERFVPADAQPITPATIVNPQQLIASLRETDERGYALDGEENELGVNCIAFPVFLASPSIASGAISIAAVLNRMTLDDLAANAEAMRAIIHRHLGRVTR